MRTGTLVAAALAALLVTACAPDPTASGEAARERLDERQTQFFAASSARDADAMAELFADDAVLHVAGRPPIQGRAAIRQFYGNMFGFLSESTATPEQTHVSAGGDMAYSIGSTSNEFRGADGATAYAGKYVLVWTRTDGDWLASLYAISSNQQ